MEFLNYNEKCILDCCTRLAHSHSHSNIHCKLCSSVHSFIHLFIRVYAFIRLLSFDTHTHTQRIYTHTRISHEQRTGEKLKMQTKCTIYIHLHNLCDFFLLCIYYFLFSFIINDARFWIHINGESPIVLFLSVFLDCYEMCADKIQISICASTIHTLTHTTDTRTHTLT